MVCFPVGRSCAPKLFPGFIQSSCIVLKQLRSSNLNRENRFWKHVQKKQTKLIPQNLFDRRLIPRKTSNYLSNI